MYNNPLIVTAYSEMKARQLKMKKEQDNLLEENKHRYEDIQDLSGEELAKKVKIDLSTDRKYFKEFQASLSAYHTLDNIPFSVRTNKMEEIFSGTTTLFGEDETNIVKIASGNMPTNYFNEINDHELPHLVNSPADLGLNQFWGTSKVTYLSSAILTIHFTLNNSNINNLLLNSAITHVSLLPNDISLDCNCRFAYINQEMHGFSYIHSGFSFGGHRFEQKLFPENKIFGPEDCSSWVSKITGFSYEFDTSDQLCIFRAQSSSFVPESWKKGILAKNMESFYYPVKIEELNPGDIFVYRDFNLDHGDPKDNLGISGHTGIILEKLNSTVVRTLCFTREMPYLEGFGTKDYSILPTMVSNNRKRIPMILRLRT